jgi:isocitrate/isopropylmalate dehydrogenase
MTTRARYTVACLSGHGIGPEIMAQASRAVAHVSRLHGFRVEETHPPFGAEAFTQSGHALPASTRRATLAMQAILVAAAQEPALAVVESELDLHSRIDRVAFGPRGEVTFVSPLGEARPEETLEHAFGLSRSSRARVASVGGSADWRRAFRAAAARADGVFFEEVPVARATQGLAFEPERFDVVVTPEPFAEPLAAVTASGRRPRVVATGRLARSGPGVFAPTHGAAVEIAGQGVANPASMLLAAALMLGEGLGERRAAETLAGALLEASSNGAVTPDLVQTGVAATTRQFADVVLSELPFAWTNAEFYREAVA